MALTVAETIVKVLYEAGARRCYGIPGDTLNYFTDAIRRSEMRFVHVRHEEAGAFAAGADALLTDELAVCAGSCGPGSLHFINGLYEANRSRAPVVLIATQIERDELGFDFPQEVDFKAVYRSGTVFCEEVRTAGSAHRLAVAAAQHALVRRGVAVLIVPSDIAWEKPSASAAHRVHRPQGAKQPSRAEIAAIADTLNAGEKVTIYCGSGCRDAHDQIVALADRLKAPVAYTSRAKDFLEHDNPFAVGMTGVFGIESGYHAIKHCDTLLLLGCDFAWRQFYPDDAKVIQVDVEESHLGRRHPVDIGVAGDAAATIEALLPGLPQKEDTAFLDAALARREKATERLERKAVAGTAGRIHPQYLTEVIARHAAPDAVWTADAGSPTVWLLRHVPATGANRTVISLTHGTMAGAMPQALGAQAAFPSRQVVSLSGDGGLTMLLGDLLTTVQEKLPIKVVVFNNGSLNFVELEQKTQGLLDTYTQLENPDLGRVAAAMGLWGRRVDDPEALDEAVREWLATPGPALLDVCVDRFELVQPSHVEPKQVASTALYAMKAIMGGRIGDVSALLTHNYLSS